MASTALITFELDLPMHLLARKIGTRRAVAAWRDALDALQELRRVVREQRLVCDWSERDSLYLTGNAHGHRSLRTEAEMRARHGIPGTFMPGAALRRQFGIDRTGALHATGVAVADPVLLTSAILASSKVPLHAPVEVRSVAPGRNGVMVETSQGDIRAGAVVFCTGYSLLPCLEVEGLSVDSTWAIATSPGTSYPAWLDQTIVWEASDPYLYLRTTADGRLLAGGRDESSAVRHQDAATLPRKANELAGDVSRLLGITRPTVDRSWSGAFGSSESGLPVIGPVPGLPGCHVVAGFGGNGITHAMLAARLLRARLGGSPFPHETLYRPRSRARGAVGVAK